MNNFRRQQLRGFPVTILTALLLALAIAFSVIGYAASDGTRQQLEAVEGRYTTIGAMKDQNAQFMQHDGTYLYVGPEAMFGSEMRWRYKNYTIQDDGSIVWDDGSVFHSANVLEAVAKDAPQIRTVARSAILSAHVEGVYGLTSGTQNRLQFNEAFDSYSYNMCIFVVTCMSQNTCEMRLDEGIKTQPNAVVDIMDQDGFRRLLYNTDEFKITEIVSAHPTYGQYFSRNRQLMPEVWTHMMVITDPAEEEFWQGKQYIMRCFIRDFPVVQVEKQEGDAVSYTYRKLSGHDDPYWKQFKSREHIEPYRCYTYTYRQLFSLSGVKEQDGVGQKNFTLDMRNQKKYYGTLALDTSHYYYGVPEDSWPFFAEVPGTLEEFLNSEDGKVWRDEIIPAAQVNQQSVTVMLVEDLDYLHAFNSGNAVIVEGREVDPSEFVRGDKVCVVSAAYAEHAGLEVGDSVNLDFYDTGYFLTSATVETWDTTVNEFVMTHNPLQPENRIGYREDYTIVGIYSAPEYEYGTTSFYADTIFVPKASVPNAENYENPSLPLLNSVVLLNGSAEEFEGYMASRGFGGYYTYFDQDYSSTISGLRALAQNALRLVILAAAVFIVTAILFYYLNFKRMIPVAYGMRRMGQSPWKLWWQMEAVTIPVILIAVLGGAYLGVYFFEYVTLELFETSIIMDIRTVQWLTVLEAAALSLISLLAAIPISVQRLMKRK